MILGKTVSLVMPCRNEAGHLAKLIEQVPDFFDEIICVSNGSTDNTVEVSKALEKRYPRFTLVEDNRSAGGIGYGFAHMTGMATATSDLIVCADSDGTYPIDDAPQIVRQMKERNLSFVSCSRYPDHSIPFKLQLGVRALNIEIAVLYWFRIHDSLSGMWVFKRSVVSRLHLTEGDWNLSPQIKINAKHYLGPGFAEIKIKQRIRQGESKQDYLKTGLHHVLWIAKNRFVRRKTVQPAD
ncbi:glycosyltransferase family 2 protein [Bifidobacterium sp. ESL0784]|uniref:glycosyltransferase family 2 protein n=1 Tax=Bifidobacterium sp. ESL0784 TaxID=2983231 RepID=UPI0023F62B11|nr:glycosyltransferase family 2 protein [Bifidobacterium sp. ESL0784]MDF7640756.1 glycosyltransferase family 2 protein [Bifidobacterium sp. ESL0784]